MTNQKKNGRNRNHAQVRDISARLASADEAKAAEHAIDRTLSDLIAQTKDRTETRDAYER